MNESTSKTSLHQLIFTEIRAQIFIVLSNCRLLANKLHSYCMLIPRLCIVKVISLYVRVYIYNKLSLNRLSTCCSLTSFEIRIAGLAPITSTKAKNRGEKAKSMNENERLLRESTAHDFFCFCCSQ